MQSDLASLTLRRTEFDAAKLRRKLDERLADWRGLLRRHPVQGQQVLKRLIVGRLMFEPTAEGDERYYTFTGTGTIEPLLAGQVVQKLASLSIPSWNRLHGWLQDMDLLWKAA